MSDDTKSPRKPTVLVTGASGLIGSRACRELGRDHDVVGMDVKPPADGADWLWLECDLTKDDSVASAFQQLEARCGRRIASVLHLAAYYDFTGEPSPLYEQLTVQGTRRVLDQLQMFEVEQFVFSSSLLVLRPCEVGELLTETSPVEATWDYPRSKVEAERVIRERHGVIPAVILRIAGVYDEDGHSIPIGQQIARIHGKTLESYFFPGNAKHGQAFVHLDDLMTCLRATVAHRRELGDYETFLVGEPETLSYAELQDILGEELHGREWPTLRIPKPVAKAGAWIKDKVASDGESFIKPWMIDMADAHRPISIEHASERLGWRPRRKLRDELPEMVRRLLSDPAAWYERNQIDMPRRVERVS